MTVPRLASGSLLALVLTTAAMTAMTSMTTAPAPAAERPNSKVFIGSVADTGQFLPDSAVIVRVGPRKTTVFDFRDGYFAIYPDVRPKPDSLGRVEFMNNVVRKELLGLTAQKLNRPFSFEDRSAYREHTERLLGNLLYNRAVLDSVDLSEPQIRKVYGYYATELRFRHLFFTERDIAERVRLQLLRGQTSWGVAAARYAPPMGNGKPASTEMAWTRFENVPPEIGLQIWPLRVGEFSQLIVTPTGYHLVQVAESRPRQNTPVYEGLRSPITGVLRQVLQQRYRKIVQAEAMRGFDLAFDTTVVRHASKKFNESVKMENAGFGANIAFDARTPEFNLDENRMVLARWNGGRDSLTIERAVHAFTDLPIIGRPTLNTPEAFTEFALSIILEPRLVEVARRRGLDKDPQFIALAARKEEEIRVTHLVEDSVFSKVVLTGEDRRRYYDEHKPDFMTYPAVHYAMVIAPNKARGDSVLAVFRRGVKPELVVKAWQARFGADQAKVDDEVQNDPTYAHKTLFEELRPGQATINGPDAAKHYVVIQSIARKEGELLPFEKAEPYVDESLQNIRAQAALEAFVDRLRSQYRIETHPELVMKIRLSDPGADR